MSEREHDAFDFLTDEDYELIGQIVEGRHKEAMGRAVLDFINAATPENRQQQDADLLNRIFEANVVQDEGDQE